MGLWDILMTWDPARHYSAAALRQVYVIKKILYRWSITARECSCFFFFSLVQVWLIFSTFCPFHSFYFIYPLNPLFSLALFTWASLLLSSLSFLPLWAVPFISSCFFSLCSFLSTWVPFPACFPQRFCIVTSPLPLLFLFLSVCLSIFPPRRSRLLSSLLSYALLFPLPSSPLLATPHLITLYNHNSFFFFTSHRVSYPLTLPRSLLHHATISSNV